MLKASFRLAEAELACRSALAIRPDYAEAHLNLGAVLADLERLPEAEAAYREAITCRRDYAEAHYNLGIAGRAAARPQDRRGLEGQRESP